MGRASLKLYGRPDFHIKPRKNIQRSILAFAIAGVTLTALTALFTNTPAKAALPAPGGVDNESIWLKANDGTSTNATWFDHSANANNGAQPTAGNQPILNTGSSVGGINFNPAYTFDNVDDRFNINSQLLPQGSGGKTVLYVTANVAAGACGPNTCNTVIGWGNGNLTAVGQRYTAELGGTRRQIETAGGLWGNNATTNPTDTVSPGISSYINPANSTVSQTQIRVNAGSPLALQLQSVSNPVINVASPTTTAYIGQTTTAGQDWSFGGKMAEVIVYPSDLSASDRLKVESYLAIKYGITLDQTTPQSYLNSLGSTIWTGDATYKYNITGIGRDDSSTLNQKQSKSVNPKGIVTVGQGTIASDNVSNTNNFTVNNSSLLFGDDNGSVSSWGNTGVPALDAQDFKQIPRKWKVQKTGTVAPMTISFDANDTDANIVSPLDNYYLLNLTSGTATPLTSGDGNNYSAGGVNFNSGDIFTIGTFDIQQNVHFKKTVSPAVTSITPGQTFTYTITAQNLGNAPQTGLSFFDDLSEVIDDAAYNNNANATVGTATFNSGNNHIEWNGTLNAGQTATITYTVTMNQPTTGDGRLDNGVVASGVGVNCTENPATDPDCLTTTPLPVVSSQKTLLSPTNPKAGDTVNYQFVITNQGAGTAATVPVADDLSEVLDDATYNNNASASSGSLSYNSLTKRLSWSGSLAASASPGDSVTVTYSVTLNAADNLGDAILNNAIISPDCPSTPIFNPATPGYDASCVTSTPVAAWTARKTVTSGSVNPGNDVAYTIQVTNTGAVNLTGVNAPSVNDDLTDVIDDATYNNNASVTGGGVATFTSPNLNWTGNLNIGQTATITYSAKVKAEADLANQKLVNTIVGSMNCPVTPITNPSDPGYNADCAVLSTIVISGSPGDTDPGNSSSGSSNNRAGGGLANTGDNIVPILTAALMIVGAGVAVLFLKNKLSYGRKG